MHGRPSARRASATTIIPLHAIAALGGATTRQEHERTSLFIGHTYIDVTLLADHWPTGEKSVASDYAVSFGGNAVTAALPAPLGSAPDLICSMAPDWPHAMPTWRAHGVALHTRQVRRSSLSCIMPNHGKRAMRAAMPTI